MDLGLLLRREEITILVGNGFHLPIHPKLLDPSINLDEDLAFRVLEQSAEDWFADIQNIIGEQDTETRDWWKEKYFGEPRRILRIPGKISLESDIFPEISFMANENGFVRVLGLLRNQGCLYFNHEEPKYIGFGRMSRIPNEKLRFYALPFNKKYLIKALSHPKAHFAHLKNSIDFILPIGATILSPKSGKVVDIKVDSNKGGFYPKYNDMKYVNYLTIQHSNNEYSQYVHLKYKGSLVNVGDKVKEGQPIALSGNTGFTTAPHLHFHVLRFVTQV